MDKCPGVRPTGVGEVARRDLSRAILSVIHFNIQEAVGSHQLCVGQGSGCEAAIHALEELFEDDATEGRDIVD